MSAKIAAVNQARSESESLERTVSLIAVDPEPVPPPPSYEQAITTLLHIERNRVLSKQRILEELAEGNRNVEQTPTEEPSTSQRPSDQQVAELPSSTPSMPSTVPPNYQIIQRECVSLLTDTFRFCDQIIVWQMWTRHHHSLARTHRT